VDLNLSYSGEIEATEGLQKAIVLYEKKLFEQCLKQLYKTKKMAETFELWGLLISLLHLEQRCYRVLFDFEKLAPTMEQELSAFKLQQLSNQFALLHYESISLRVKYAKARSSEQIEAFENLITRLEELEIQPYFYTEFHRLEARCNYYYVKDDLENEMLANGSLIELMQRYEWYVADNPLNYIAVRTRLLGIQRRISPQIFWQELDAYRQLSKQVQKQKQAAEVNLFIFSHNFQLDQYLLEKRWKEAFELIPSVEKGTEKYRELIDVNWLYSVAYRFAAAAFFSKNYKQSLDYILKILNEYAATLRPDLYKATLFLQIMVHYEMGNYKLIPSLVSNARYHIKKDNQLFKTEALMLTTLKRLSRIKKGSETERKIFNDLKIKLLKFKNDAFEKKLFEVVDFLEWAEDKAY
jgi:hypothetical protein